jgi:hypothetical protein
MLHPHVCSSTVISGNSNTIQSLKMQITFGLAVTTCFNNCRCYVVTHFSTLFWYSSARIEENHEYQLGQLVPLREFKSSTSYTQVILLTADLESQHPNNAIFILSIHECNTIYYMIFTSKWNPLAKYVTGSLLMSTRIYNASILG